MKNMIDMEALQRLYPIGIQTFSEIREKNYLYIDKNGIRLSHDSFCEICVSESSSPFW